jgi:hypothetical protein
VKTIVELVDEARSVLGREHFYRVVLPGGNWTRESAVNIATDLVYEKAENPSVKPLGLLRCDRVMTKP